MNPAYLAPILGFAASLLLGLMGSCTAGRPTTRPTETPVLAPTGRVTLDVEFRGSGPRVEDLYVCGWAAGADGGFSCVEYQYFQEQTK